MRRKAYVGILKNSSIENHMIDPINVSQCSYLSGEVLGSVRIDNQSMRLVRRVH